MSKASRKPSNDPAANLGKHNRRIDKYFRQRYPHIDEMSVIHRHAAGIDLGGKLSHYVAIEIGDEIEVREFGMVTSQIDEMARYLSENGITTVAMESTGVYWVPVWDILERHGLEVCLVNPAHAKNVPGRPKNDKYDCRWLQKLHRYGLLSASFRPDEDIRPLRGFARHRMTLVSESADYVRRMQKLLDMMNVRIHKAVSDMGGVTGMRIVRAIASGQQDPVFLATLRDKRCQISQDDLVEELTGSYSEHLVKQLASLLRLYDALLEEIATIDLDIEAQLKKLVPKEIDIAEAISQDTHHLPTGKHPLSFNASAYVELVTGEDVVALPGIGPQIALGLLAELGRDMSKWPTEKHFGSYLTLSHQHKISGNKVLSSRTRPGTHPAAVLFKQAAAAVVRCVDCALAAFYRRLAVRIGKAKALTALAYKIARMYYYLMKNGQAYVELGEQAYEKKYRERQVSFLHKKAAQLGFTIIPTDA